MKQYLWIGILLAMSISAFAMPAATSAPLTQSAPLQSASSAPTSSVSPTAPAPTPVTIVNPVPEKKSPPAGHLWNLQGVSIKSVITEISRETGKNFILDPQVDGKVTIISSHPMGAKETYQVFLSALRVMGFSVVPDGKNLKIVPSRDAANQARLAGNRNPGAGDEAVVRVIPVYYVSAIQLIPALRPLLPTWGNIGAYPPSNSIIVSGSADNVQRIAEIISQVDTEDSNGIDVMVLKHAVADDIVKEVNQLILSARANGASTNATLSADPQSNSVLIGGDAVSRLHLKVLIAKLDASGAEGQDNEQVITLKYIQVKDILPILKAMVHQPISMSITSGGGGGYSGGGSSGGGSSGGDSTNLGQASPQFNAAANSQINNASLNSSTGGAEDKNRVTIVGDVTNNDLIMSGSPSTMIQLRSVISKLDIPPQQVVIQGVIAEVDASTLRNLGIQWGTGGANQAAITGTGTTVSNFDYSAPGMGVGFLQAGDMRALVQMLQTDANSNILDTPSVTVINNSSADIEVGQNVYDISGQYQPGQGTGQQTAPYVTYTPKQIGLTLKVIPQITGDGSVRMVIYQENSAQIDSAQTSGGNIPTSEEKISTQVIVNNGQILVLGGLTNSQDRKVVTRVPILGYIPILGLLFQNHTTQKVKKDLMIFLRPIIVTDQKTADRVTNNRNNFMHDVAILNKDGHTDMVAASILPKENEELPTPFNDK